MCLSVYIGTARPLRENGTAAPGALAIEPASWRPVPLERSRFVYYAGRKGERGIECSCLLSEGVDWSPDGARIVEDPLLEEAPFNPFETLRGLVAQALADKGMVTLVCDDSGGSAQAGEAQDYTHLYLPLSSIRRGGLIFADMCGMFPWRCYTVVSDAHAGSA